MTFDVTEHQFRTILRALDEIRADHLLNALDRERAGDSMADTFYESSRYHEEIILALQAQA